MELLLKVKHRSSTIWKYTEATIGSRNPTYAAGSRYEKFTNYGLDGSNKTIICLSNALPKL